MKRWGIAGAGLAILIGFNALYAHLSPSNLAHFQDKIEADFPTVSHISSAELNRYKDEDIILLDIRKPQEFAVSHLTGAIRIDPDISANQMLSQLPPNLSGKRLILYCSVGYRSSDVASRVKDGLMLAGAEDVVNLEGGIFGWHNEKRPLVTQSGPTDYVHPYDEFWKRYIKRKALTRYSSHP